MDYRNIVTHHENDWRLSMNTLLDTDKQKMLNDIALFHDALQKVAAGDYTVRITDSVGQGGLSALAGSFDAMVEKLSAEARNVLQSLDLKALSEDKYRELLEDANSIILKWDRHGIVVYINKFAQDFFGFSNNEIVGQSIIGTIVPETESSGRDLVALMRDICSNPSSFISNNNENLCKDGKRVWVSWSNHPLVGANGEIIGILSFGQDVSEKIKMEEKLQQSEQRFRSFIENVNDVVFAITPTGTFSYVSPQWKLAFGHELSDTIGQPFMPFVHPDDVPGCLEFLQLVISSGQKQSGVEYRVLCKNGCYLWYTANASLMIDPVDGTPTLVAIGRDISQRKLTEEALRQSEEKFSAAFRSSPDAIAITRVSDNTFLEVNDGFAGMTGYRADEVIGKSLSELNLFQDPAQEVTLLNILADSGSINDVEVHFRRKNGTELIGQVSARLVNIAGESYALSITRDITLRECMQKELLKVQKLESISVLAGGIAHNFNNVLTGVIGYISYAKKYLSDPDKVLPLLEAAEKSSFRAAALARQLLTFSKGGSAIKNSVLVEEILRESLSLFLTGTNVSEKVDCEPHPPIYADAQQISQAFNNIILNAVHAMPEGGVLEVRITSASLPVGNRHLLPAGDYVKVVFTDSGCGIAAENLNKIYDPYYTTKDTGTGLGLSTTFSIISKHGGHIEITSDIGKSTTVTILLPCSVERPLESDAVVKQTEQPRQDMTILLMDDEEMIRDLVCEVLQEQGYRVTACASGDAAVILYTESLVAGNEYDLVILDLVVKGGIGGVEAAKRILAQNPRALLVVSSGYSEDTVIAEYEAYGFSGSLTKPYNAEQLVKEIAMLAARRR